MNNLLVRFKTLAMVLSVITMLAFATDVQAQKSVRGAAIPVQDNVELNKDAKQKVSLEERAEKLTDRMAEKLELDKAQYRKTALLNKVLLEEVREVRRNKDLNKEEKITAIKNVNERHNSEMQQILNKGQYVKFLKMKAKMQQRMIERIEKRADKKGNKGVIAPSNSDAGKNRR